MKTNLRLLCASALLTLGMGAVYAQSVPDPLVDLQWAENGEMTNAGTCEGVTGKTNYFSGGYGYRRRCPAPTSILDPKTGKYIGSKDNGYGDSFYYKYSDDSDVANAFLSKYTIEVLYSPQYADTYRLTKEKASNGKYYFYERNNGYDRSAMGSWNGWGWLFYGFDKGGDNNECGFWLYCTNKNDYTNGTTEHKAGADQTLRSCKAKVSQVPGKFYHLVAIVDYETSHSVKLYVDGELCAETAVEDTLVGKLPVLGSNGDGMKYIALGACQIGYYPFDPAAKTVYFNHGTGAEFVNARVYGDALTDDQVKALYEKDDVQYYTKQDADLNKDMLLDVQFATNGDARDASSLNAPIVKVGTGADGVTYDAAQGRNVANFVDETFQINGADEPGQYTENFYYRDFSVDPNFKSRFADCFTVELYAKPSTATPAHLMSPFGCLSYEQAYGLFPLLSTNYKDFGVGCLFSTKGRVGFNVNTAGWKVSAEDATKGAWTHTAMLSTLNATDSVYYTTDEAVSTAEWQHLVMVYDRLNGYVGFYKDGEPVSEAEISPTEYLRLSSALFQSFGIGADISNGGDAKNGMFTYVHKYGDSAFDGDMSICRVWGKALTSDDIQALYAEAKAPGTTVTTDAQGYATLCVPYNFKVPAGVTIQVISSQDDSNVKVDDFATAGEVVAYGTPVIVKGEANQTYSIEAVAEEGAKTPAANLLYGTYVAKDVPADFVYELNSADEQVDKNASEKTLDAHTAYLPVGESTAASKKFGTPTGITITDVVPAEKVDNVYYDLSGRRINKPAKGLYLQKGKKVIVK